MPELPEVETTRQGIEPLISGCRIVRVELRVPKLRWLLDPQLSKLLSGQTVHSVGRRAKYLMVNLDSGCLLIHLGMTGNLRVVPSSTEVAKHDHVDLHFDDGQCLRFTDPRRFGAVIWVPGIADDHPLLSKLGPEPLSDEFFGEYLYRRSRKRSWRLNHLSWINRSLLVLVISTRVKPCLWPESDQTLRRGVFP